MSTTNTWTCPDGHTTSDEFCEYHLNPIPRPSDDTNNRAALEAILTTWLDDAMGSSLLSVGIDGYKGSEKNIDARRDADYNQALNNAIDQLTSLLRQAEREAAYNANRAVLKEQKKFLSDMTLSDGKTVIKALAVGMMYACANKLAEPLEAELKAERDRLVALQVGEEA